MYRTSIGIKDADFKKIKANSEKKSVMMADYIRTLIQIGLKVEEASELNMRDQSSPLDDPETHWKTLLTWQMESRYLMRYLIKNGFQEPIEQRNAFLKEAKEKAALRIQGLLDHQENTNHSE